MSTAPLLTSDDETQIATAIAAAEQTTSGEIVAVIAHSSGNYGYFALAWAALVALLVPWPLIYLTWWSMEWVFGVQLAVFVGLLMLLNVPALQHAIVPPSIKRRWAHQKAVEQFLAQGLHTTAERTGVLIFVSVAERYAEIIADTGINVKVQPGTWKALIDDLTRQIGAGQPAEGFLAAIATAGTLLATHFPAGDQARDELPNRLIVLN